MSRESRLRSPLIGLASSMKAFAAHDEMVFHAVGDPYIAALEATGATPIVIPCFKDEAGIDALLSVIDGLVLTGAIANVHPDLYGGAGRPCPPYDPRRDSTVFALIGRALARNLPVFGICRGLQEINVAMGGSLHARLHEVEGHLDHRSNYREPLAVQFAPAHPVRFRPDGWLGRLAGGGEAMVNSLHGQGIDRLAPGLAIEATAPDGQIEAVRAHDYRFVAGVQWHPEWDVAQNAFSRALFEDFLDATLPLQTSYIR